MRRQHGTSIRICKRGSCYEQSMSVDGTRLGRHHPPKNIKISSHDATLRLAVKCACGEGHTSSSSRELIRELIKASTHTPSLTETFSAAYIQEQDRRQMNHETREMRLRSCFDVHDQRERSRPGPRISGKYLTKTPDG